MKSQGSARNAWRNAIGTEEGKTLSEIIKLACTTTYGDQGGDRSWRYADLHDTLRAVASRNGVIHACELGKWLSRDRDRIAAGLRLEGRSDSHGHAPRWWLVAAS